MSFFLNNKCYLKLKLPVSIVPVSISGFHEANIALALQLSLHTADATMRRAPSQGHSGGNPYGIREKIKRIHDTLIGSDSDKKIIE